MNFALPAIVLLLGLLPGVCCFYGYFAGRFDKRTAGVSGVEELALYVILGIPLNAVAVLVCRTFAVDLDFDTFGHLLAASPSDATISGVASKLRNTYALSSAIYLTVLASSFLVGSAARRSVWALRLDTWVPVLQLRHTWFYALQGRLPGVPRVVLPYVDVLTEHPDGSRLYRGLVVDFEISSTGAIDSLTLRDTKRGKGRGPAFVWVDVPSTRLAIIGSKIHSLNITYVAVEQSKPPQRLQRLRLASRTLARSFAFEEP